MLFGEKRRAAREANAQALEKSLREDDVNLFSTLKYDTSRTGRYNMCLKAIENEAPGILAKVLERNGGFNFSSSLSGDAICARQLFTTASASPAHAKLLPVLYARNETTRYGRLSNDTLTLIKITSKTPNTSASQEAAPVAETVTEGLHRLNDYTLEEVQKLSNGTTLTTVFNFLSRQQKDFVTNEAGVTSPIAITSFDTLSKEVVEALQARLDAHAKPKLIRTTQP